jgi:hypothetical protein
MQLLERGQYQVQESSIPLLVVGEAQVMVVMVTTPAPRQFSFTIRPLSPLTSKTTYTSVITITVVSAK